MGEGWKKLRGLWKGKLPLPALAVLAAGCLLLLLPSGTPVNPEPERSLSTQENFDLAAFEQRLERALSEIEGAGETRVVLSLDSGSRRVLAQDREQDSGGASVQTVTVGSGSAQNVVPVQTVAPAFRGALVVSPGAGDARVRLELTKAVGVLTGLGSDCICVTTGTA